MADRVIFVCTLVLAGVYFYATAQIPTLEIGDPLGPKAFPRLIGIGLLITAGMLLVEILRNRKIDPPATAGPPQNYSHFPVIAGVVVWTALYFWVFQKLGYVLSSAIYLFALMAYFHRGKWVTNTLTAVLFAGISYQMFSMLGTSLPRGVLPF